MTNKKNSGKNMEEVFKMNTTQNQMGDGHIVDQIEKFQALKEETREICEYDMRLDTEKLDLIFEDKFLTLAEEFDYAKKTANASILADEIRERYFAEAEN